MFYRIRELFFTVLNFLMFSYLIDHDVCYLCISEKSYSRKLAFSFLEEINREFTQSYGNEVNNLVESIWS